MTVVSETALVVFPTARTVLWSPRRAGATRTPETGARFCITQRALARLEHDVTAPGHPGFGFLLGAHYHCPELDVDYAVVDTVVAGPHPTDAMGLELPEIELLRDAAAAAAATTARALLGWFQVRGHIGSTLSPARTRTHHELLGEPWQRTLVLTPGPAGPTGCFYRAAPGEAGTPAAFYEVADVDDRETTRKRTCVTWTEHYVASEPVTLLHESVRRAIAAPGDAPSPAPPPRSPAPVHAPVHAPVRAPEYSPVRAPAAARATPAADADASEVPPPSIQFPLYVPARDDDGRPAPSAAGRWWQRLGAAVSGGASAHRDR